MKGQSQDDGAVLASLQGVHKDYGKVRALDGLDLQVHGGELLALLGPNGAGKTTAIALLLGLARADSGQVALFGQSPSQLAARRRIGVMLQSAGIPDTLRVGELLELTRSYYPDPLNDRERQVLRLAGEGLPAAEIATRLGLSQGTVRNYLSAVIGKLGVGNRIEAYRLARQKGWL